MKWFKHDTSAHLDAKLQKLRIKHGLEGYGLYFYCLELIAMNIDEHNLTFELEHDSEIIAFNTGLHYERVQEIISDMVRLELFENNNGQITCFKLAARLDQSMTSNSKMRNLIAQIKQNHDGVMTGSGLNHDEVMTESCKKRGEEKRGEEKRSNKAKTKSKKHPFPQDFCISDQMKDWFNSKDLSIDMNSATDDWKDNMLKDQDKYQYTDWIAAWRSAMKNADKWNKERSGGSQVIPLPRKPLPKAGSER